MGEYVTIQGDMWDQIALKVYGSEKFMSALMESNPDHLQTAIFTANQRLQVPDIPASASTSLPPWKRG